MSIIVNRFPKGPIGENTYLIRESEGKEAAILDPGYFGSEINTLIDEGYKVKYILLTHAHGDHIYALNQYIKTFPEAIVIADEHEAVLLEDGNVNGSIEMMGKDISCKSARYVKDNDVLMLGNEQIQCIYTPGHTIGCMCYLMDGIVFTGDILFRRSVGATHFYTGDWDALQNSIRMKLYVLPEDTIVYPGHYDITTIDEEKEHNPFV
ncbi:MAG: MBL fold metallo-hydrolase [Clostridiales bacterium]|nr:MBL fold metallo-hydrolase [Clostridiales bacterium]